MRAIQFLCSLQIDFIQKMSTLEHPLLPRIQHISAAIKNITITDCSFYYLVNQRSSNGAAIFLEKTKLQFAQISFTRFLCCSTDVIGGCYDFPSNSYLSSVFYSCTFQGNSAQFSYVGSSDSPVDFKFTVSTGTIQYGVHTTKVYSTRTMKHFNVHFHNDSALNEKQTGVLATMNSKNEFKNCIFANLTSTQYPFRIQTNSNTLFDFVQFITIHTPENEIIHQEEFSKINFTNCYFYDIRILDTTNQNITFRSCVFNDSKEDYPNISLGLDFIDCHFNEKQDIKQIIRPNYYHQNIKFETEISH